MKIKNKLKVLSWILFIIFILSLIPVIFIGLYNHPLGDDYYYGANCHVVWITTHSLIETIKQACREVALYYKIWQGTYSGIFLMALQPAVFSENAYKGVTFIILLLLNGGIYLFLKSIIYDYLKQPKYICIGIFSIISLLCIQLVPSQGEAFFWYNGSIYYTGYFGIMLMMFSLVISYELTFKKKYLILSAILTAFLAGGNYITVLTIFISLGTLLFIHIINKEKKRTVGIFILFLICLLGFAISAFAPGNAVRQNGLWKATPVEAILLSLKQGFRYFGYWIRSGWVIAVLLLTPFFIKIYQSKRINFKYPLIVIGYIFGFFSAMSCPTFYAMHSTGPARAVAIIYYGFVFCSIFIYFYVLGYFYNQFSKFEIDSYFKIFQIYGI